MDSLLVFILAYVMLLGMHWLFRFEYRLVSGKIRSKIFWVPLRIASGVVVALCIALPIIMLLNGVEFLFQGNITDGLVLVAGAALLLFCSYRIFWRKRFKKECKPSRDKEE